MINHGLSCVIIGAGNAGTHIAKALKDNTRLLQIYSRTPEHATRLGQDLNIPYTSDIAEITKEADIYILCIKDDAIMEFTSKLNIHNRILVHISGTSSASLLSSASEHYGVMWPIQTLSSKKEVRMNEVPFCIEASDKFTLESISSLASKISPHVFVLNETQRMKLHVAATITSNFVNHLYALAYDFSRKENIPFEALIPLIRETSNNPAYGDPSAYQTGPAFRKDLKTIERHQDIIKDHEPLNKVYGLLTEGIITKYHG